MDLEEIKTICAKHPEVQRALADAFGHAIPLSKLSQKPDGIIGIPLLCETLEEYREISGTNAIFDKEEKVVKHIPHLYVVWQNGSAEKSSQVGYRCIGTTYDDWTGDVTYSGEREWDEDEIKPTAHLFVSRADVRYVIRLEKTSHGWVGENQKIDSLTIELFFPSPEVDIQATARAIMSHFEEYGDMYDFGREEES